MIRILPKPGLLSSLVVAVSVASGIAFGAVAMSAALVVRSAARRIAAR